MNWRDAMRWVLCAVACIAPSVLAQTVTSAPASTPTINDLQKLYWQAKGATCSECDGSGHHTCRVCKGADLTKAKCSVCKGVDQTKLACRTCRGVDQTTLVCRSCKGADLTRQACRTCKAVDQTKLTCSACSGSGRVSGGTCYSCGGRGRRAPCYSCGGRGTNSPCYTCGGTGKRSPCYTCGGTGTRSPCFACGGRGTSSACYLCQGKAANGGTCSTCAGSGAVEIIFAAHATSDDLLRQVAPDPLPGMPSSDRTVLRRDDAGQLVAENGSYFGEISDDTRQPKVVFVNGYLRKDGTYVRSHYRSLPLGTVSARGPPLLVDRGSATPFVAENGSYYGELNDYGVPKTVHVRGYYRKDGTYVRGHYRSRPKR